MAGSDDLLSPDEIEALMKAAQSGQMPSAPSGNVSGPASTPASSAAKPPGGDLLNADEIEALMNQARSGNSPAAAKPSAGGDLLGADEIEALMSQAGGRPPMPAAPASPPRSASGTERLLQQAESQLAAAMAPDLGRIKGPPAALGDPQSFNFQDFGRGSSFNAPPAFPIAALQDVELDLRVELGRTELLVEEVLQLREGTVVPLDKLAGDPVDIIVNGRLIARGEVLVLNDNFCVRVAEILTPDL